MRNVFLLGGGGDIGKAIARKFNENGYNVIAPTRQELNLEDITSIDGYFKGERHDIDIDVIVHSAGWNLPKPIDRVTIEDIRKANSINVLGFYRVTQHLLPRLKKKKNGHIVAISSLYGVFSRRERLPYVMSKHALNGLIKTLALELGPYNIKVNIVSPGFVDTKMTRKNNDLKTIRSFEEKIPLGRLARPEDIANITYFLCSPENNYINGANIIVDGGYSIGGFQIDR